MNERRPLYIDVAPLECIFREHITLTAEPRRWNSLSFCSWGQGDFFCWHLTYTEDNDGRSTYTYRCGAERMPKDIDHGTLVRRAAAVAEQQYKDFGYVVRVPAGTTGSPKDQ